MSGDFLTDDFSAEYLNGIQQDEKAAAVAWALKQTGGIKPSPTSDETAGAASDGGAARPADSAEALMAESLQAGLDSRADVDYFRAGRDASRFTAGVARNLAEIPRGAGHGAIAGVNEAVRTVYDLADWARQAAPDWLNSLMDHGIEFDFRDGQGGYNLIPKISTYSGSPGPERVPQLPNFSAPETPVGQLTSNIVRFVEGFVGAGKALKFVKPAGLGGQLAKAAAQGAVADFTVFDPLEDRLSNLVQEVPALANPVTEFLAAQEDDGRLEGRLKNTLEGLGLGAATEGLTKALGAGLRVLKKVRAAREAAKAGPEAAEAVSRGMKDTATAHRAADAQVVDAAPVQRTLKSDHPYGWSGPDRDIVPVEIEHYAFDATVEASSQIRPITSKLVYNNDGKLDIGSSRSAIEKKAGEVLESMGLEPALDKQGNQLGARKVLPSHEQTGWKAEIGQSDIGKILNSAKGEHDLLAIEAIPELWRTSAYIKTIDGKKYGAKATHFFENRIKIGADNYRVEIKVREFGNGRSYYYQKLTRIDEPVSQRRASVSEEGEASRDITGSGDNIAQAGEEIKGAPPVLPPKKSGGGDDRGGTGGNFGGSAGEGPAGPSAVSGTVNPEIEALEKAGFQVDHDAYAAPATQDGKRLYGISRRALEAEGTFGDRWTNIVTDPAAWPEKPAAGKGLRGQLAHLWREKGWAVFNKVRGIYAVDKTGEKLVVGGEGGRHLLGQSQRPEAIQALPHLPEIIKKAFKVGEYNPHPSSAAKPDIRRAVIYRSAVVIDGEPYSVQLVAKRKKRGLLELDFYDLRANEKTGRPAETQVLPGGPVEPSPTPILTDLPEKGAPAGTREMSTGPTGYPPAPESGGLSETRVADFFGDVKEIAEEVPSIRPDDGGGHGRPGGPRGSGGEGGGNFGGPAGEGPAGPSAVSGTVNPEIEALEKAGFQVDHDAYAAPATLDGKRRFGVTRQALEAEGVFGDRWTRIETKPDDWPPTPERKKLRGEIAHVWRKFGKPIYDKVRGEYKIDKTGEIIIVGKEGGEHIFGQGQTPEAIKTLPHLPEIIKKAFKFAEYNPKARAGANPDSRIKAVYHSAVIIDGLPSDVQMLASRREDGAFVLDLYDVRAREKAARSAGTHDMPGAPVEADPTMTLSDLAGKAETGGAPRLEGGATGPHPNDLSEIKIADFFGDVKEIAEEVPAVRPDDGGGHGRPGGPGSSSGEGGGNFGGPAGEGPAGPPAVSAVAGQAGMQSLGDVNAPLVRPLRVDEVAPGPPIQSTAHEKGVTALPKNNRRIMDSADFKNAKAGDGEAARRVADKLWTEKQTQELAARLDPNKETIFISMPSTTGTNQIPNALAKNLAGKMGGTHVDGKSLYRVEAHKPMKEIPVIDRPFSPRGYTLENPEALQALAGKQIVVVEDILTTGASARQFIAALRKDGVEVTTIAGLMGNPRLDASPQLVSKLQATLRNAGMDVKGRQLAEVLSEGEIGAIIRRINQTGDANGRAELAAKLRGLLDSGTAENVGRNTNPGQVGSSGPAARESGGYAPHSGEIQTGSERLELGQGRTEGGHNTGQETARALRDRAGPLGGPGGEQQASGFFINFSRIDAPEDVKTVMQNMADGFRADLEGARRGVRTFQQTTLSAEQEDAWKILAGRRTGEPLNAEQSLAARNLWASSGQKLSELAELAVQAPTEENLFAFRKMMEVHRAIQNEVVAARTETARALGAWRIPSGPRELNLRQMAEILETEGGFETARDLAARAAKLTQAGMVRELDAFVAKTAGQITLESLQEAWVMALLSGPKTHLVNTGSNMLVAMQQVFERGVAGKIGEILGDQTGVAAGEALSLLGGLVGGVKDGLRLAWKALRHGESSGLVGKVDTAHAPAISAENWRLAKDGAFGKTVDVIGKVVRAPGRALMAEDEFFKAVGYRAELQAQAYRQATREAAAGKIGRDQVQSRIVEILENPPDNIHIAAVDHATYSTFTNAPGDFAKAWAGIIRRYPPLKLITPFVKTPANIFNYAVAQRSPFAPLFRSFREDLAAGGARAQLALARASTGTTLMLAAADMAFNGQITGGGPANPAERQTLARAGWQPYSVKVGDRYFSYNRVDPLGSSLGIAADLVEIVNHMDQEDQEVDIGEASAYFAVTLASNVLSKSYLSGLAELIETLADPERRAEGFAARLAGSFVPTVLAEAARMQDPYRLEINSMLDAMRSRVPGLSKGLPARRDLWGRAISYRSGLGAFYDAVSPIYSRRENPEPIDREMLRQETYIAAPKRQVNFDGVTVDLTRPEFKGAYSRYAKLAGNELKHPAWGLGCMDYLNAVATGQSPMSSVYGLYSDGPEGGKSTFIRAAITEYRDMAKRQLLKEYPHLRDYVREKKAARPGKYAF